MIRRAWPTLLVLLVSSCAQTPVRRSEVDRGPQPARHSAIDTTPAATVAPAINPCAPTRRHLDSDYTPGGLYAPGVADSGPSAPIDISGVREPVPRAEPRSRYGNRSPYTVLGQVYRVLDRIEGYHERGIASWYGSKFNGRATSSGEPYDMCAFSAAHKTLPLPSFVRVTNLDNGRSLIVRVNDRGPFHSERVMDLSYAAAVRLGVDRSGTARVDIQAVDEDEESTAASVARQSMATPFAASAMPAPSATSAVFAPPRRSAASEMPATTRAFGSEKVIQVGSFGDPANARRLADRLQDAGLDAISVDQAQVGSLDVWRVRLGPLSEDKLHFVLQRLRELDLPNARVLSE